MIDRENVINGLGCIKGDLILCVDCAYSDGNGYGTYSCKALCANDAIAMLKEQEAKNVVDMRLSKDWFRIASCPKCNELLRWVYHRNHCGYCGQAVKWEC